MDSDTHILQRYRCPNEYFFMWKSCKTYKSIDENDYMNKTTLYQPYMESLKIIIITSMNYEAIITDQLLYYIREIDRNYRTENYFEKIVQDNQVIIKDPGYD